MQSVLRDVIVEHGVHAEGLDIELDRGESIRGSVRDGAGNGIAEALVTLHQPSDQDSNLVAGGWVSSGLDPSSDTEPDGEYEISGLVPGTYELGVSHEGYLSPSSQTVALAPGGSSASFDFVLEPGVRLEGRILDASGRGASGLDVSVTDSSDTRYVQLVTREDGRFLAAGLLAGRVRVEVSRDEVSLARVDAPVPGEELLIRLEAPAAIAGRVVVQGLRALPEGVINVQRWQPGSGYEDVLDAPTDITGRFSFEVPPGKYLLTFSVPLLGKRELELTLRPGERRELDVTLRAAGKVRGVVVRAGSGEPIRSAEVFLTAGGGGPGEAMVLTDSADAQAAFEFEGVPEGLVRLAAWQSELGWASREGLVVTAGKTLEVRIEIAAAAGLSGHVHLHGRPLARAVLTARGPGGAVLGEATAGPEGLFALSDLPPGEHHLEVEAWRAGEESVRGRGTMRVRGDALDEVDIDLGRIRVAGRVLVKGEPVFEASVRVDLDEPTAYSESTTYGDGEYEVDVPGPGAYVLEASGDLGQTIRIPIEVPAGVFRLLRDLELPAP